MEAFWAWKFNTFVLQHKLTTQKAAGEHVNILYFCLQLLTTPPAKLFLFLWMVRVVFQSYCLVVVVWFSWLHKEQLSKNTTEQIWEWNRTKWRNRNGFLPPVSPFANYIYHFFQDCNKTDILRNSWGDREWCI